MKSPLLAVTIVAFFSMAGCAANVPLNRQTQSGFAEATFRGKDVEATKAQIMNGCVSRGLMIPETGGNHVICSRTMTGGQAMAVQLAIGNGYSTTPVMKMRYTLVPVAADTRVTVQFWAETQMAMGQVRTMDLNGNADRNAIQDFLSSIGGE